ncbi:aspartic proteinase nepenthesin-1-like [Carex rostrata]
MLSIMSVQTILIITILSVVFFLPHANSSRPSLTGFRAGLTHIDSNKNFSKLELLQRMTQRSHHRMSRLVKRSLKLSKLDSSPGSKIQSKVRAGNGEYLMDMAIGTPSQSYSAIVDTGSDLIWTQCKPCVDCFSQSTPIFDPSTSSTYKKLPCAATLCKALPAYTCNSDKSCEYQYSYGDSSSTQGTLSTETITLGSQKVADVTFGCGDTNDGAGFSQGAGLVGLGKGPLSLTSQLGLGKFSYCLTSLDETKTSPLFFGSLADFSASSETPALSTPLVKNPSQPSFYYLSLKGITVGSTKLAIPNSTFALDSDGTGGLIIDSGTSITYLEFEGYKLVKKAFTSQMQLPVADGSDVGLDLCFTAPSDTSSVVVPKFIFHFDGADLDLPADNYIIADSTSGLLCLTVMGSRGMSILGNFQQQNFQILYDVGNDKLSFMPAKCDKL